MKLALISVAAGCATLCSPASAQIVQDWLNYHDGSLSTAELAYDVVVGAGGTVAIAGLSYDAVFSPQGTVTRDVETACYDASGALLWSARWDSPFHGDDYGLRMTSRPSGGFVVTGESGAYFSGNYEMRQIAIAYDATGTLLWSHTYGTGVNNRGRDVLVSPSGDIYLAGADGGSSTWGDMCVRKLDAAGNVQWVATYDGQAGTDDFALAMALAPNGDVVMVGNVWTAVAGVNDIAIVRVSPSGAVLWAREFDGGANGSDSGRDVVVDAGGTIYVVGMAEIGSTGADQVILAYDSSGNLLWSDSRDGTAHADDLLTSVAIDRNGRIVTAGNTVSAGGGLDFSATVYSPDGTLLWTRTWGGTQGLNDTVRDLTLDQQGNVYVAGFSTVALQPLLRSEGRLVCWDPNGNQRFVYALPGGSIDEYFVGVATDPGSGVYVGGYANQGSATRLDFVMIGLERTSTSFCFGDGTGIACPCGNTNTTTPASGCANALGVGGTLFDTGSSSLSGQSLVLHGANMPSGPCLYLQGTTALGGGLGSPFGDGLRCVGGTNVALGVRTNVGGASEFPSQGSPSVATAGLVSVPGTRHYQVWYRDSTVFCTSATFGLTNGVSVTWLP